MQNLICKIRIEGDENQLGTAIERLSKVFTIVDKSRYYPNINSDKARCYLVISLAEKSEV